MKYSISPTYERRRVERRFDRALTVLKWTAPLIRVVATVESVREQHMESAPQQLAHDQGLVP